MLKDRENKLNNVFSCYNNFDILQQTQRPTLKVVIFLITTQTKLKVYIFANFTYFIMQTNSKDNKT